MGSAQSVEHYEIARYGTLIAWAEADGHDDIVRLLNTNLKEEKAADKKQTFNCGHPQRREPKSSWLNAARVKHGVIAELHGARLCRAKL